jgi:hypothetical protein
VRARFVHIQLPQQRRTRHQPLGKLGQLDLTGGVQHDAPVFQPHHQSLIHRSAAACIGLPHHGSGRVEQRTLQYLHLAVGVHLLESNRLTHGLVEDGGRVQQVILVVLLTHSNCVGGSQGLEADGRGVYLRRHVLVAHEVHALFEAYLPVLAHHREVLVVDGERNALRVLRGRGDHVLRLQCHRCPHQER